MRLLMLALVSALSLTSLAAAQSNAQPDEEKTGSLLVQHPSTPAERELGTPEQQAFDDDGVCYTMRSYIFERHGTEAPRLVGMVTCTRSTQRQFKRAQPAPMPKFVPAD